MKKISLDSDWKEALREYLLPMTEAVLPKLYAEIDLDESPVFLDNEIESLAHELWSLGEDSVQEVDLFVDLPMKNKLRDSVRLLLRCEVQRKESGENLLELRYTVFLENKKERKKTLLMIEERAIKQGLEKGMKQGLQQGLREGKLAAARNMLALGLSPEIIKKATGLTKAQLGV